MARERRTETNGPGVGHNSIPPTDKVRDFFGRIENLLDELAAEKGEYMERAREIRAGIQRVMLEAEEAGIPKREFKAVMKTRQLENKLEAIRDGLQADEQETFDQIRNALGDLADLPLGQAALKKAEVRA